MSRVRLTPWTVGLTAALLAAPCHAQGNIDAGKSPAQIFADTCAVCHRNARELRNSGAGFLRQHYTSGYEEASSMANYLAALPSEPRAAQPKRPPASVSASPAETAKQQSRQPAVDQPKSSQAQSKGRRSAATAEIAPIPAPVADDKPPPAPRAPVLEPFYE